MNFLNGCSQVTFKNIGFIKNLIPEGCKIFFKYKLSHGFKSVGPIGFRPPQIEFYKKNFSKTSLIIKKKSDNLLLFSRDQPQKANFSLHPCLYQSLFIWITLNNKNHKIFSLSFREHNFYSQLDLKKIPLKNKNYLNNISNH